MRVIARNVLAAFWGKPPETQVSLERWYRLTKAAHWTSMDDVRAAAPKAKVLNRERARFEVAGGSYRLVVAFDFRRQIAFVKFVGTHADIDGVSNGYPAYSYRAGSPRSARRNRRLLGCAGGQRGGRQARCTRCTGRELRGAAMADRQR